MGFYLPIFNFLELANLFIKIFRLCNKNHSLRVNMVQFTANLTSLRLFLKEAAYAYKSF